MPFDAPIFDLHTLDQFHADPVGIGASSDYRTMYVGYDDVHGALAYVHGLSLSRYLLNMFGYDDEDLNAKIMGIIGNPRIPSWVTLDLSQAGGKHEAALLAADRKLDPVEFASHVAIGQSATHSISHTKGGVLYTSLGLLAFEGSTNWSRDGEGTFILGQKAPGGPGYKAQNNTLTFHCNSYEVARFETRLMHEHSVAVDQMAARLAKAA